MKRGDTNNVTKKNKWTENIKTMYLNKQVNRGDQNNVTKQTSEWEDIQTM